MRISLLNGTTIYPLAGQAGVAESVHSSAADYSVEPEISKQTSLRVRAEHAVTWDRKNLKTTIRFSTVRTFATCLLAEKFANDYDETVPRSGILIIEGTGGTGYPDTIIVAGDLTTDGSTPAAFPTLEYDTMYLGHAEYSDPADSTTNAIWADGTWEISLADVLLFTSTEDVASPDLVTAWTPFYPATGAPRLIGSYPDNRHLLDAVIDPPSRQVIGCSVLLSYSVTGGRLAADLPGTWSSEIPWPVGGNWEDS